MLGLRGLIRMLAVGEHAAWRSVQYLQNARGDLRLSGDESARKWTIFVHIPAGVHGSRFGVRSQRLGSAIEVYARQAMRVLQLWPHCVAAYAEYLRKASLLVHTPFLMRPDALAKEEERRWKVRINSDME